MKENKQSDGDSNPPIKLTDKAKITTDIRFLMFLICTVATVVATWMDNRSTMKDHGELLKQLVRSQEYNIQADDLIRFSLGLESHNTNLYVPKPPEYMRNGMAQKVMERSSSFEGYSSLGKHPSVDNNGESR